jgi:hypothetical protein
VDIHFVVITGLSHQKRVRKLFFQPEQIYEDKNRLPFITQACDTEKKTGKTLTLSEGSSWMGVFGSLPKNE